MEGLHSIRNDSLGIKAIFEIELEEQSNVFMSVSRTNYMNDERYVVIVDSEKFLELWRSEPNSIHSEESMGNIQSWKNDRKYQDAVKGFSEGLENPVPVANIVCQEHLKKTCIYEKKYFIFKKITGIEKTIINYVAFTNGITRTLWLLVQGAKYFPVECSNEEDANRLAKAAGYGGNEFMTVENLTKNT